MINTCLKQLKFFLILRIKKVDFFIVSIFDKRIKFLDLLFFNLLNKLTNISLVLLLSPSIILLLLVLNALGLYIII